MWFFDDSYREVATLRDGETVVLRLVRPSDKELMRRGFAKLSPESRYTRFFTPKLSLTEDELRYLTEIDHVHHLAIGAIREHPGGEDEGLGVARFISLRDEPGTAEAAIAVLDEMQGKGLGSLLFMRLVAAARERGVERVRCEVLGSNHGMQEFLKSVSVDRTLSVESGVVRVELTLPPMTPAEPPAEVPRDSAMYKLLRMVARGAVETRAVVARMMGRPPSEPPIVHE
ncbi:MAG: GNAT family N-acetyltransferase [Deltaproteobacteria bacterium]|nr:GNAT family N-acetyltransferase [Deltaproteobacteria bacterium]